MKHFARHLTVTAKGDSRDDLVSALLWIIQELRDPEVAPPFVLVDEKRKFDYEWGIVLTRKLRPDDQPPTCFEAEGPNGTYEN